MKNARNSRIIGLVGATAAAVALSGATPAVAGAPVVKSKVTITEEGFTFKGKVKSDKHICEARRLVRLYRIDSNENKFLVGGDKTDNSGSYKVDVNVIEGNDDYFAVAQLKETGKATCAKAKSPSFVPSEN